MSESAIQRVLAALERVDSRWRHQSGGYSAQCPAHEDRNPSLSIKNGDGKVLLACQAHCQTSDVLAALGLHWADLFDTAPNDSHPALRPTIAATYDYRDAHGILLYQKVRYLPKAFRVRRSDGHGGWIWSIGDDTARVLYRLPEVLTAVREGRTIYVCEGEKDVDALVALGYTATCNYDGAAKDTQRTKWRESYSDTLVGAHVVVIADNDAAGYAHARAIERSVAGKAASVTVTRGAVTADHADVSDHLDAGLGVEDLVPIAGDDTPAADDDVVGDPIERIHQHEVAQELRKLRVRDEARRLYRAEQAGPLTLPTPVLLSDLLAEPDQPIRYRIEGLLPAGGRVVLAAQFKAGKSTLIGNLMRCLADGYPFLGCHPVAPAGGRIVLVDNEMPRDTIKYWLRDQRIRETSDVAVIPTRGNVASFDVINPDVRKRWVELIRSYEPSVLIVDCLRPVLDALGLDENTEAGQVLVAMDEIAAQAGATELVIVHHMGHLNERSRGDSRIRDWPDVEWRLVRKDTDDPSSQRFFTAYGRDVDVPETAVEYDPVTRHLSLALGNRVDVAATVLIPDLFQLVTDQPGLSGRAIEDLLMDAGVTRAVARAAINGAVDQGVVSTVPGPKRSTLYYASRARTPDPRPVRRSAPKIDGALNHDPPNLQRAERSNHDAAGQSASAPVRHNPPTSSGALRRSQCAGVGEPLPEGEVLPGALNEQLSALEQDHIRRSSGAPENDQPVDLDTSGDRWVHAHLTTTPQTLTQLATDLDATTVAVDAALKRLTRNGHAQQHSSEPGKPTRWSLP